MAMESKKSFVVFQRAEGWYRTEIEAGSKEEALARAQHASYSGEWELDLDSMVGADDWDVEAD
jgi:hypothetical protein